MIICIEGVDAAGKNTQAKRLAEKLGARLFSFPRYETVTGAAIRGHLSGEWQAVDRGGAWPDGTLERAPHDALVLQALMTANRYEAAHEIETAAKAGDVILDRYWPSGYVYGSSDGLSLDWLAAVHERLPVPDLYILLDVDVETSIARRPDRRDRYERDSDKLRKVAAAYRYLWTARAGLPAWTPTMDCGRERWRIVDGRQSLERVSWEVNAILERRRGQLTGRATP